MSRTDELRSKGARERGGGGGGAPFVKWPEKYAYIEGRVLNVWEGKFGESATMKVAAASEDLLAAGKTEDGEKYSRTVEPGMEVNVGLNYASLQNTIQAEDEGADFHIAFEGWDESKAGDRFRMFTVLELPKGKQGPRAKTSVPADGPPPHDDRDFSDDDEPPF